MHFLHNFPPIASQIVNFPTFTFHFPIFHLTKLFYTQLIHISPFPQNPIHSLSFSPIPQKVIHIPKLSSYSYIIITKIFHIFLPYKLITQYPSLQNFLLHIISSRQKPYLNLIPYPYIHRGYPKPHPKLSPIFPIPAHKTKLNIFHILLDFFTDCVILYT